METCFLLNIQFVYARFHAKYFHFFILSLINILILRQRKVRPYKEKALVQIQHLKAKS